VGPPGGAIPLDGDLEAVPLVERHVSRPPGDPPALDPVLVDAREPRSQQQASLSETLPRGVHADEEEITAVSPARSLRSGVRTTESGGSQMALASTGPALTSTTPKRRPYRVHAAMNGDMSRSRSTGSASE
jgi:hypothetical protein